MENQLELLEAEALKLSAAERAAFTRLLLASLDKNRTPKTIRMKINPFRQLLL